MPNVKQTDLRRERIITLALVLVFTVTPSSHTQALGGRPQILIAKATSLQSRGFVFICDKNGVGGRMALNNIHIARRGRADALKVLEELGRAAAKRM